MSVLKHSLSALRDLHFYIAHRFIHIRAVYKYGHSLRHTVAQC